MDRYKALDEEEQDDPNNITISPETENEMMATNPSIVYINATIKRCTGCGALFKPKDRRQPHDLVIRMLMNRIRPDASGRMVVDPLKRPAYFHWKDLGCVKRKEPDTERRRMYMPNQTFHTLTKDHKALLQDRKYWDAILHNRREAYEEN